MKHERSHSCLITALLATALSFSGVCCMVTGMEMFTANLGSILTFCAIFSLLAAILGYYVPHGVLLCACSSILLALGLFWPKGYLTGWASALIYHISNLYSRGYGWPVIQFGTADPRSFSLTPGLCAVAGGVILAVVACLRSRKAVWPAVAVALLPLSVCLVLTDTVPSVWCLILLVGSLAVLLLSGAVRRRSGAEGNRLVMGLLLPVFLATAVLFAAVPMQSYVPPSPQLGDDLLNWATGLPIFNMNGPGASSDGAEVLSLNSVGPKGKNMQEIMQVFSSKSGSLYLRGQAYIEYDGLRWKKQNCTESGWPRALIAGDDSISISTRRALNLLYTPYYVDGQADRRGSLVNGNQRLTYTFIVRYPDPYGPPDDILPAILGEPLEQQCLTLPQSTLNRATALLDAQGIPHSGRIADVSDGEASVAPLTGDQAEQVVAAIANYVRSSARYDLMTRKLPAGEKDFALWFLTDSDTGYCVHFASAAVVLLRAAGIPSRYVTGYMVEAAANTPTVVHGYQSHAWVEYFNPDIGWQVLEVTPSADAPLPSETTRPPETTQESRPPETQGTQPPESSEGTQPPHATDPVDQPPAPGTPKPGQTTPAKDSSLLLALLWVLLAAVLVIAAIWGQYALRLSLRRRRLKQGSSKEQALYRWRIARLWDRHVTGHHPPQALKQLAEKAMFSQHQISPQELAQFDEYFAQCAGHLRQMPWPRRLLKMLLWALPR